MFFSFKYHSRKIYTLLFITLIGCQIQEPSKNHGILFLENRSNELIVNKANKNDAITILGNPHSKSLDDDNVWFYLERTLGKGKYHKLGRHVLKNNNVLVLSFDKYGVLKIKEFYNKENINKVAFSDGVTENKLSGKSFVESFLESIKQKMYSNRKN